MLASHVAEHVRGGYRVESQTDYQAIMVRGRRPNHLLHLVLSVLTFGVWALFVWLPVAVLAGEKRRVVTIDPFGNVQTSKGRG